MRFPRLAIALSIAPCTVLAQDASALLRHGAQLRQQGEDAEAAREFARAYELDPSPNAAGQLGLAEQELGRWLSAERHLREALAANDDRWVIRNRASLQAAHALAEQHVGTLEVRGQPAGAEVLVDGLHVGTLPIPDQIHVLAGTARLDVRASGRIAISRSIEIGAGRLTREQVDLALGPVARRARPPLQIRLSDVLLGVGTVGFVFGGLSWGFSFATIPRSAPENCTGFVTIECASDASVARAWSWTAVIAGSVGVVALGIGIALLATRSSQSRTAWMLLPTPGGLAASWAARF
jgi:hypothetical protein